MGNDKILERFAALCKQHKAPPDLPLKVYSFQNPPLDASDPASIAILAARVTGAGLIVIDNLGTISGEAEENASTMRLVMANLRWLAEETGAAVIVIHHQRKSNGISGRAGDALRGHSSIEAALDLALHISREPYSDQITIKSTKTRAREVAPFTAYFSYTQDDSGDLETAQFYSVEPEDNLSSYAIEREIKAALKTEAMTQSALWQAVKSELPEVGKPRILDMIRQLEDSGAIRMTPGMKNAKVYTLPANRVSSS
jgi:RecA-family ATPase